jgi:hypothetical protein
MASALSCRQPLGGLISMSSWFPRVLAGWCDGQTVGGVGVSYGARRTPALLCHGLGDLTVPPREGKEACARLIECGINVEAKEYSVMAHDFCIAELLDVHRFLLRNIPRVERLLSQKRNPHEKEGAAKRRADWGLTKMHPWSSRYLVSQQLSEFSMESEQNVPKTLFRVATSRQKEKNATFTYLLLAGAEGKCPVWLCLRGGLF